MDRRDLLRAEAGASDASRGSDAGFHTANDTTSESTKYLSLSDENSFTPKKLVKDSALCESTPRPAVVDSGFGAGLSPIAQSDRLGFGNIDASKILSGGVDIFDDCISNDEDGLVIDDDAANANEDAEPGPVGAFEKVICEPNESANLIIGDNAIEPKISEAHILPSDSNQNEELRQEDQVNNNEVTLLIDGQKIDALNLGNGLYLYRKEDGGELHAIQNLQPEGQPPQYKFLKVRQIGETNLEVYEEQILEVPISNEELEEQKRKEKREDKPTKSHLPISDVKKALENPNQKTVALNTVINENSVKLSSTTDLKQNLNADKKPDQSGDSKINPLKNIECSRKSPILGNITSMTLHSSSKKEGPTKTMINLPLNPSRNSDSVKKTIKVSTGHSNSKNIENTTNTTTLSSGNSITGQNVLECSNKTLDKLGKGTSQSTYKLKSNNSQQSLDNHCDTEKVMKASLSEDKKLPIENDIMECCKDTTSSKSNTEVNKVETKNVSLDTKKESNSTKLNVVSKWVLRSDSVDEKSKKEKEKILMDAKSTGKTLILDNSLKKDQFKTNFEEFKNKNVHDSSRLEFKERVTKVVPKTPLIIESKKPNDYYKTAMKPEENQVHSLKPGLNSLCKTPNTVKAAPIENKNLKKETTPTEFTHKYTNPALKSHITSEKNYSGTSIKSDSASINKPLDVFARNEAKNISTAIPLADVGQVNKPVPFGKWTEGDKQQYLNKLKDQKLPSVNQTLSPAKSYQLATVKNDMRKFEIRRNLKAESFEKVFLSKIDGDSSSAKPDDKPAKDVDMKGIIDTTITGIIMKTLLGPAGQPPALNHPSTNSAVTTDENSHQNRVGPTQTEINNASVKVSYIPDSYKKPSETLDKFEDTNILKDSKIPKLLPIASNTGKIESPVSKSSASLDDDDSEDEIIDNEPVTGDMQWSSPGGNDGQKVTIAELQKMIETKNKVDDANALTKTTNSTNLGSKSLGCTYAANNTVHALNTKEAEKNTKSGALPTIMEKTKIGEIISPKNHNQNNTKLASNEPVQKTYSAIIPSAVNPDKPKTSSLSTECTTTLTKVQLAYQSALSAKNLKDPPVKVVDSQLVKTNFVSSKYEQTKNSSITSKHTEIISRNKPDTTILDLEKKDDCKVSETSPKTKHQRKQVLTPVESPLEVIEHSDEPDIAHKKKRKIELKTPRLESNISEPVLKDFKTVTPKKNYLLGRTVIPGDAKKDKSTEQTIEKSEKPNDSPKLSTEVTDRCSIESTVNKAYESNVPTETPKRGRGRPKKQSIDIKSTEDESLKLKPPTKSESSSFSKDSSNSSIDKDEDYSDDEEGIPRENWTMGKINDNIVCPICKKLFRTENIVFKHVKHCSNTNKSPTKRTSAVRHSTESPTKKGRTDYDNSEEPPRRHNKVKEMKPRDLDSMESVENEKSEIIILDTPKTNVIVIEDTPQTNEMPVEVNKKIENAKRTIPMNTNKSLPVPEKIKCKTVRPRSTTVHTCEVCNKTFRQLSYLAHHRLQHKKDEPAKQEVAIPAVESKPLSCEVCRKEFRKLHHLVQHRDIHNQPNSSEQSTQRKSSVDKPEQKKDPEPKKDLEHKKDPENKKEPGVISSKTSSKPDELTAGFRCEPCDKSFRKLHHLVEHRETHDGLHKPKISPPQTQNTEKPAPISDQPPTCEVCKKSFRKLHHLIEHREQHTEANAEKRERKSSLLAKDIIHECSICYMVFPNEPSLNKHSVQGCPKRKKKSVIPSTEGTKSEDEASIIPKSEELKLEPEQKMNTAGPSKLTTTSVVPINTMKRNSKDFMETNRKPEVQQKSVKAEPTAPSTSSEQPMKSETTSKKPVKIGLMDKRLRNSLATLIEEKAGETKESDDEARYMINPSYIPDQKNAFMEVCVAKRNSLNFDSCSAETDLKKRRTSLHHPPQAQSVTKRVDESSSNVQNRTNKSTKSENQSKSSVPSVSQDIIDIPLPKSRNNRKSRGTTDTSETKSKKIDKRKSLTGIAKRKSLGKSVGVKAATVKTAAKDIKKCVMHVCDCGAPFSSVTLLAQHTSVAHTPPRVRRPRLPPPPKHAGVPVALKKLNRK